MATSAPPQEEVLTRTQELELKKSQRELDQKISEETRAEEQRLANEARKKAAVKASEKKMAEEMKLAKAKEKEKRKKELEKLRKAKKAEKAKVPNPNKDFPDNDELFRTFMVKLIQQNEVKKEGKEKEKRKRKERRKAKKDASSNDESSNDESSSPESSSEERKKKREKKKLSISPSHKKRKFEHDEEDDATISLKRARHDLPPYGPSSLSYFSPNHPQFPMTLSQYPPNYGSPLPLPTPLLPTSPAQETLHSRLRCPKLACQTVTL